MNHCDWQSHPRPPIWSIVPPNESALRLQVDSWHLLSRIGRLNFKKPNLSLSVQADCVILYSMSDRTASRNLRMARAPRIGAKIHSIHKKRRMLIIVRKCRPQLANLFFTPK
jgi:hypothetical protein